MKNYRGFGFYVALILLVILVWYLLDGNHLSSGSYNYTQFEQELTDGKIAFVEIHPNREIPTGSLEIVKTDNSDETLYVSDVQEVRRLMQDSDFTHYDHASAAAAGIRRDVYSVCNYEQSIGRRRECQDDEFRKKPGQDDGRGEKTGNL